jgi:sulfatase maturation enzyme AslB (radical SAM superfamily)
VSGISPLLEEANAFRPVGADGQPIFRWDPGDYAMIYAPGTLCVMDRPDAERFEATIVPEGDGWGGELWRRAEATVAASRRQRKEPFRPECLTLYMNNECNLDCAYCYADPSREPAVRLDMEAISAAARVVAESCQRKGRRFYSVFHGGGEPTLHSQRVEQALALLDTAAEARGVELFRYVATNGVMSEEKAGWLARRFDLVGLSCDGPPDIQNSQRPRWGGGWTSQIVERTGRVLRQEGCRIHVRTTITPATLSRQAEIADYVCTQFAPEEIHVEPVYCGGKTSAAAGLHAHHAGAFVAHFLEARHVARRHGILLTCSGSRPNETHGPYCNIFRQTLNLVPGGVATACFKITRGARADERGATIGALNLETGRFELDAAQVQDLRRRLSIIPAECADCFNRYHCVRECPDRCPLDGSDRRVRPPEPGFRCRVAKALTYATLREKAERLWTEGMWHDGEIRGTENLRPGLPVGSSGH